MLSGIFSNDSAYSPINAPIGADQELDQGAFMQLLVTQLQNQDPLEPQANEEFVAQLANFSSLEQMELLNENVVSMVVLNQSNALMEQMTSASSLIGRTVNFVDPETGDSLTGNVESVKIRDGAAMLLINGQDVPLSYVTEVLGTSAGTDAGDSGLDETGGDDTGVGDDTDVGDDAGDTDATTES